MKSLLLILALITFTQCSIEKRLYRPGWHVTWKNKSHHRADVEDEKTLSVNDKSSTFKKNSLPKDSLVENVLLLDTFDVATHLPVEQQKKRTIEAVHDSPNSISQATLSVISSKKEVTFVDNPKSKYEDSYQRNWGLLVLALGIICLIIAGLCVFIAVNSSLPNAILFLIGTYIFGLIGIALFLAGFVISLFILAQNLQVKRQKEADRLFDNTPHSEREEREETEPNEENSQNTTSEQTDSERTDHSKLKTGILFAAAGAFLIGLFLLFK